MADTASVPLMEDMDDEGPRKDMEGGGLENDFSFNNNVAGASKHVRLGRLSVPHSRAPQSY